MFLVYSLAIFFGLIASAGIWVYSKLAFSVWINLRAITFDNEDTRGLYYGMYHELEYLIWVPWPADSPELISLSRYEIEVSGGSLDDKSELWYDYYRVSKKSYLLKLVSWWNIYKSIVT